MKIINQRNGEVISANCEMADNFFTRFRGLMGRKRLEPGGGLLITPCNSIHMFFMKFPIDAVFLDKENRVLFILEKLKPWRVSRVVRKANSVLELPAGTVGRAGVKIDYRLDIM